MTKSFDLVRLVCTGCGKQLPPLNAQKQTSCSFCGNHFILASSSNDEGDQQFSYLPLDQTSKIIIPLKLRIAKELQAIPNFLVGDDRWASNYSIVYFNGNFNFKYDHAIMADNDPLCVSVGCIKQTPITKTSFWSGTTKVVEIIETPYADDAFKIFVLPATDSKGRLVGHRVEISLYDEKYRSQAETVIDLISTTFGVIPTAYLNKI